MAVEEYDIEIEAELIRKIGEGDRSCLEALYDRFSRVLYALSYRVLRNEDDARDVIQDVFIQIWEKASLYDSSRGKPLTWAMTMTRNKSIDRLRALQRRLKLKKDFQKDGAIESIQPIADASEEAYSHEKGEVVRAAVAGLADDQRQAIELAFFGGLTQLEISEKLGLPLGTVKARIRRGMMKLRSVVEHRL